MDLKFISSGPGTSILDAAGGSHRFQGWNHNLLTDSGGFQLVSLNKFTTITEEGATFASPFDGKPTILTVRYISLLGMTMLSESSARRKHAHSAFDRSRYHHAAG
jgi:tRNA-guanine family transglycosylase